MKEKSTLRKVANDYLTHTRANNGITLIALVITIIVLLILAGVAIATLTGENGILTQAGNAKTETTKSEALEKVQLEVLGSYGTDGSLDNGLLQTNLNNIKGIKEKLDEIDDTSFPLTVTVDGEEIKVFKDGTVFNSGEWDKTAMDEKCFVWGNEYSSDGDYSRIVNYRPSMQNYTIARIPSRCESLGLTAGGSHTIYDGTNMYDDGYRAYAGNIIKLEIPPTVSIISSYAISGNSAFKSLNTIVLSRRSKFYQNVCFL